MIVKDGENEEVVQDLADLFYDKYQTEVGLEREAAENPPVETKKDEMCAAALEMFRACRTPEQAKASEDFVEQHMGGMASFRKAWPVLSGPPPKNHPFPEMFEDPPAETGQGYIYTDSKTISVTLPKNSTERLKYLQEKCAGGRSVEMFFSGTEYCFVGDEEGRYRDNAHVNKNRDLARLVPNHDIYGTVFMYKNVKDAYDDDEEDDDEEDLAAKAGEIVEAAKRKLEDLDRAFEAKKRRLDEAAEHNKAQFQAMEKAGLIKYVPAGSPMPRIGRCED